MKTHKNAKAVMDLLNLRCKLVAEQKEVSELPLSDEAFAEVVGHYGNRGARVAKSMIASSIANEIKEVDEELSGYVCTKYEALANLMLEMCDRHYAEIIYRVSRYYPKVSVTPEEVRTQCSDFARKEIERVIKYIQKEV